MAFSAVVLSILFAALPITQSAFAATWVYTANESGGSISVIDADAGKKRATIRGLRAPHNIHLGPDGMLYVTDGHANQAVKIAPDKLRIGARWEVGSGPAHIFMTPDQRFIVNTYTGSGDVPITEASTLQPLATIPVGKSPHGIAISPDGKFAYIANLGSKDLAIVDLKERKLAATIPVDDAAVQAWVEPQGRFVYVTGLNSGQVFKIDAASRKVVARLPVGKLPAQLGVTPDGRYLISCDQESAQLSIYDAATDKLVKQLPLGAWTHGISFSPDSKYAFVTNTKSDDVSVVDLGSLTEAKRIKVGKGPNGIYAGAAEQISLAAIEAGLRLRCLVDVNVGQNRCGVEPGEPALALAERVARFPGLQLVGLQGYEGHLQHIVDVGERQAANGKAMQLLSDTADLLLAR